MDPYLTQKTFEAESRALLALLYVMNATGCPKKGEIVLPNQTWPEQTLEL